MARFSFALLAFVCGVSTVLAGSNHALRRDNVLHSRLSSNFTERNSGIDGRDWKLEKRSFDDARFSNYEAGLYVLVLFIKCAEATPKRSPDARYDIERWLMEF